MGDGREAIAIEATRVQMRKHPKRAVRLGWASVVLWLFPIIAIMFGALLFPHAGKPWWAPYTLLSWIGGVVGGVAALVALVPKGSLESTVSADSETLKVTPGAGAANLPRVTQRSWEVPLTEIVHGTVIAGFGVQLETEDGARIDVEVASTRDAHKLLAACDVPAPERRFATAFRGSWLGPALAFVGVFAFLIFASKLAPSPNLLTPADALTWMASALGFFGGAYFVSRPPKVEVGADGLDVQTKLGSRFVSFEELEGVSLEGSVLTLALHGGDELAVRPPRGNTDQQRALLHRIEMGMAAHANAPDSPARLALLDRQGRSVTEWRERLDEAVNDDTGYRRQPLSRDDLTAILASPSTSTERRIGAAIALVELDGDAAAPRIRIAAEGCAEERARDALLRVADAELEHRTVQEALDVEEERARVG